MGSNRVFKKISTPFDSLEPTAAILMVNLLDPQISTMKVFLLAIAEKHLPFFVIGNKLDLANHAQVKTIEKALGINILPVSLISESALDPIKLKINQFPPKSRVVVLGVFNSGKTSLIAKLTGKDLKISDMPGTTTEFTEYQYKNTTLIDTVGQVIDISKPLMVSVDLSDCQTMPEKLARCLRSDAEGILASLETSFAGLQQAVPLLREKVKNGGKVVTIGAGASALVAMEIAGQAWEVGIPVVNVTNNFASCQPVSFAKGTGEEEGGLARYIAAVVEKKDVLIGISASGGTGFVYEALRLAKEKGATTIAITENRDTPLGKNADIIIKSDAKPEGPASSRIQAAHLAIGHALIITLASELGISAEQAIEHMTPETITSKKRGIK